MQIPWERVAIAVLIILVLLVVFFIGRKKERFEAPQKCTADQDEIDGTCYERCREGFLANGENCYEVCKPEEKSEGPVCISSDGSSRTISSYARSPFSNVQPEIVETIVECEAGYDSFAGFCIEKCKDGFTKTGFMCLGNCPPNSKTLGIMCADETKSSLKESYFPTSMFPKNKDTSNVMSCPDGYNTNGTMCIENCPLNHILKGSFCMEKCTSDETDLDTMCLKGQALRRKLISVPRVSTIPIKTSR
jgi:hypothetical protein